MSHASKFRNAVNRAHQAVVQSRGKLFDAIAEKDDAGMAEGSIDFAVQVMRAANVHEIAFDGAAVRSSHLADDFVTSRTLLSLFIENGGEAVLPVHYSTLADIKMRAGNDEGGLASLENGLARFPDDMRLSLRRIWPSIQLGNPITDILEQGKAVHGDVFVKAVAKQLRSVLPHIRGSDEERAMKIIEAGVGALRPELETFPESDVIKNTYMAYAVERADAVEPGAKEALMNEVHAIFYTTDDYMPKPPAVYLALGRYLFEKGEAEAAIDILDEGLDVEERNSTPSGKRKAIALRQLIDEIETSEVGASLRPDVG